MPVRIQRKRTKGWRMPPNTVYVGRPSKWGNPFPVIASNYGTAVRLFKSCCISSLSREWIKQELKGKNLACWCPLDQPCHADVLLEVANER